MELQRQWMTISQMVNRNVFKCPLKTKKRVRVTFPLPLRSVTYRMVALRWWYKSYVHHLYYTGSKAVSWDRWRQLSLPSLRDRKSLVWLWLRRGMFTCVGWQVILCDLIWQVTLRNDNGNVFKCPRRRSQSYVFCSLPNWPSSSASVALHMAAYTIKITITESHLPYGTGSNVRSWDPQTRSGVVRKFCRSVRIRWERSENSNSNAATRTTTSPGCGGRTPSRRPDARTRLRDARTRLTGRRRPCCCSRPPSLRIRSVRRNSCSKNKLDFR